MYFKGAGGMEGLISIDIDFFAGFKIRECNRDGLIAELCDVCFKWGHGAIVLDSFPQMNKPSSENNCTSRRVLSKNVKMVVAPSVQRIYSSGPSYLNETLNLAR